jgi:hypothetical protein
MIIYNGCWVDAKQQSFTHSNDYLQQMLNWCLTTITHLTIIYKGCWVGAKQQSFTHSKWLFTTDVELKINNNHSLTPMIIFYSICWVSAEQQSII